jgi:hypothetical protein
MSLAEFVVEPTNRRETQVAAEANGLTDPGLTELENATTGISYSSGNDTTTIDNNVTIDSKVFSIEAPSIIVGNEDIPVSIETPLQVSTSSVTTAGKGTIHMSIPSGAGATEGDGELGTGISFSRINTSRRGALIASFQDGSDRDRCGLKFFTKDTTSTATDEVETEAMTISSSGNITAQAGLKVDGYLQKRYMRASNTDTGSVNASTWGSTTPSTNISYPSSFNSTGQRKTCDTNFLTESSGVFTFTEAGTYYIRVTFTAVIKTNVTHNVALYFSVNDNNRFPIITGSADERGRMGIAYCKDENNVPANTCTFGDMYYFAANDNFRCKCLLDGIDGDATWDDTLPAADLDMYIQYEFEKISDDNVSVRWS